MATAATKSGKSLPKNQKCSMCEETFAREGGLLRHYVEHHGEDGRRIVAKQKPDYVYTPRQSGGSKIPPLQAAEALLASMSIRDLVTLRGRVDAGLNGQRDHLQKQRDELDNLLKTYPATATR